MIEDLGERFERWVLRLEEKDPLRAFLLDGVTIIFCLLVIGFGEHILFYDAMITGLLMLMFGTFQNGNALFVIGAIKHCIVVLAVIILMLGLFVDLESAWLRLISA